MRKAIVIDSNVMVRVTILTCGDIGKNFRLLRIARSFMMMDGATVNVIGSEKAGLPKDLERSEVVKRHVLPDFNVPFPFVLVFGVPLMIWKVICIVYHLIFLRSDVIIASTYCQILDVLISIINKFILGCKLVIDVAPFNIGGTDKGSVTRTVITKLIRFADTRIVSTKAMEVVLKMRQIDSVLIKDPPGTQFKPRPEMRAQVCEILGVDENSMIISIPMPVITASSMTQLWSLANNLDVIVPMEVVFVVFCDGKMKDGLEKEAEQHKTKKVKVLVLPMNSEIYWNVLGISNLGICYTGSLHGLDVTNQLVELAASGVPILAYKYGTIREYVHENENGFLFTDESSLLNLLKRIIVEKSISLADLTQKAREYKPPTDKQWARLILKVKGD